MKTKKMYLLSTLFLVLINSSCSIQDEKLKKDIIGTFSFSLTEMEKGLFITGESKITFQENGIFKENTGYTFTIFDESIGEITLRYILSANGTYDIKDSYLLCNYRINTIKMEPVKSQSSNQDYLYKHYQTSLENHFLPALKQELKKGTGGKVKELNDKRMIVQDTNGQSIIYDRYKLFDFLN